VGSDEIVPINADCAKDPGPEEDRMAVDNHDTIIVLTNHPYELPEIVGVSLTAGLPAYLDWVATQSVVEQTRN
jgi:CutA1 divalent ion tolerance protein